MAEGRVEPSTMPARRDYQWMEIFKSFQVALDPRKLLVAAAGILVMSFGWYLLSTVFYYAEPVRDSDAYSSDKIVKKVDKPNKPEDVEQYYKLAAQAQYDRDHKQWLTLHSLAGKGGKLRTMPWDEFRGENPFAGFRCRYHSDRAVRPRGAEFHPIGDRDPACVDRVHRSVVSFLLLINIPCFTPLMSIKIFSEMLPFIIFPDVSR